MMFSLDPIVSPFADYAFMRRALAACLILALGGTPLGLFMALRRMTLVGDAISHAILPGVAAAFLAFGLSLWPMTAGGLLAGALFAGAASLLTRFTHLKEDAAFTLLYLIALASGVTLVTLRGNSVDLLHLLFGNILAIDAPSLILVAAVASASIIAVAALYRRLVIDGFDPDFLKATCSKHGHKGGGTGIVFFLLLTLNLVASFQALGTLMALGLMILPGIAARFWSANIDKLVPLAILIALASAFIGLLLSFYATIPSGPAVVLCAGAFALVSALCGCVGSVRA